MRQPYHFQKERENIEMFAVRVKALFHSLYILQSLPCQLPCNMFISAVSFSDFSHCYLSYLKKKYSAPVIPALEGLLFLLFQSE